MEAREPVVNENDTTPMIMRMIQIIFSPIEIGVISPYPTVTIVVTVK
jgi:hypothetical protein